MKASIRHGDCREVLPGLGLAVDSVVTDPPYGLKFMGKRWDYDVPSVETWAAIMDAMKPGAHLLAFGGTRTYHRLTCMIEDAGWEIRDCIMWIYGSGFPKSLDIGKSTEAKQWQGYGTALKPAHEPICLAMKSLSEKTYAKNALVNGVAGINVDGCRVESQDNIQRINQGVEWGIRGDKSDNCKQVFGSELGRFPANVIHDGIDEVVGEFPNARFFYCAKPTEKEKDANFKVLNIHTTVKPLALMRYLLKLVTMPERNLILDPFMGSGTTGVACQELGLSFIGIDDSERSFQIARDRIIASNTERENASNPNSDCINQVS